jgi:AcrR family transcriptional regulator
MKKTESPMRKKILKKARTLFGKKGYSKTTVKDIASAFGCEPANIYNYFESKEAILFEVLYEETAVILEKIRFLKDDHEIHPVEQVKTLLRIHGEVALGETKPGRLMYDTELMKLKKSQKNQIIELRDEYDAILRAIIRKGMDMGVFKKADVNLTAYAISSMIMRLRIWYNPKGRFSKDELLTGLVNFALRALGCEEKYLTQT